MSEIARIGIVDFRAISASVVIEKLRRELQRIEQAHDSETVRDHVLNAFWTAWHVHKWMWNAIDGKPKLKRAVLEYRGIASYKIDNDIAFGAVLASRFVPLKICRQIATSSSYADISPTLPETSTSISIRPTPTIVILGRPMSAVRLLMEVDQYWLTMIVDCGIDGESAGGRAASCPI
jgi:hypothetical protein